MNFNDLKYYKKLYEEKNFTKVANFFNITQPSVSTAIKRLESFFNTTLVIRGTTHSIISFTDAGKQLYQHTQSILNEINSTKMELDRLKQHTTIIGLPPIIKNAFFGKIATATKEFDRQFNIQHMTLYEAGSNTLKKSLINGNIDIALLGSLNQDDDDRLKTFQLASTPFYVFLSSKHPLANKKGIYFKELKGESFISLDANFIHEQAIEQLKQTTNHNNKVFMKTNDINFLMSLVSENLGIAILAAIVEPAKKGIVTIPLLDSVQPIFNINIAFRKNHVLTVEEEMLVSVLSQKDNNY